MHYLSKILLIFCYLRSYCCSIELPNDEFIATIFENTKRGSCNAIIFSKSKLLSSRVCLNRDNYNAMELEVCYYPGQCLTNTNKDFCSKATMDQDVDDSDIVVLDIKSALLLFDETAAANFNKEQNVTEFLGIKGHVLLCSGKVRSFLYGECDF